MAHREFLGGTLRYGVSVGATQILVDVAHQAGAPQLDAGLAVSIGLGTDKALYLAN